MENKETIKEGKFIEFYNSSIYESNCFNNDGSLNKNYNSFKSTGIIASIFKDHWEQTYNHNRKIIDKFRPNAPVEIQKVIDCFNKDLGSSVYECPKCNDIIFVGHICKSRLCSSCGYKYKNDRVENILQTSYNCQHRQIVFTIPKELRKYFFFPFENRIVDYDGTYVTFSYIDHKDNQYHKVKLKASDFIITLLRHLLPTQFKIIRYYGFYRLKHSLHLKIIPLIKKHCRKARKQLIKYELSISMSFHRNPFDCPKCGTKMDFVLYIE